MKSRKSFLLRIDPRLYDQLASWAAQDFRSINGQIEFLLRQAVARRQGGAGQSRAADETAEEDGES